MTHRFAAALLLLPLTLIAQSVSSQSRDRGGANEPVTVSMEFRGGTLARFVKELREVEPSANVVLATKAEGAMVPAMVLKDAGLEQALEGACMAAEADFQVRVKEFRGDGQPVFSITAFRPQMAAAASAGVVHGEERMRRIFSLNNLTAERPSGAAAMKVRTILSAIDMAVADSKQEAMIRYHEDSGLLLVAGSSVQLGVVEEALRTLEMDLIAADRREQLRRAMQTDGGHDGGDAHKKQ